MHDEIVSFLDRHPTFTVSICLNELALSVVFCVQCGSRFVNTSVARKTLCLFADNDLEPCVLEDGSIDKALVRAVLDKAAHILQKDQPTANG